MEFVPLFPSITHREPRARQRQVPLKLTRGKFAVSSIMEAWAGALKQDAPRKIRICMKSRPAGRWMIPRGPRARNRRYAGSFRIKRPSNRVYESESALIVRQLCIPEGIKKSDCSPAVPVNIRGFIKITFPFSPKWAALSTAPQKKS